MAEREDSNPHASFNLKAADFKSVASADSAIRHNWDKYLPINSLLDCPVVVGNDAAVGRNFPGQFTQSKMFETRHPSLWIAVCGKIVLRVPVESFFSSRRAAYRGQTRLSVGCAESARVNYCLHIAQEIHFKIRGIAFGIDQRARVPVAVDLKAVGMSERIGGANQIAAWIVFIAPLRSAGRETSEKLAGVAPVIAPFLLAPV